MPKFHVICNEETLPRRVVLEVDAPSGSEAKALVEDSRNPYNEFDEVGDYVEPETELVVQRVVSVKEPAP